MIFNFDVKGLEVLCVAYLSKDQVLYKELNDKIDIHTMNESALGLPTRKVAKTFKFRTVYGGMYFHNDPDFAEVSTSKKFWDKVIEKYYEKYNGIYKWHQSIIRTVCETGMLVSPTGRSFKFEWKKNWKGEKELPITQIKNYPVQSLGADIMSVIRVDFYRRFMNADINGVLINTVHDSIVLDLFNKYEAEVVRDIMNSVLEEFPSNFEKIFGVSFDLKIHGEITVGSNMYDMVELQ